MGRSEDRVDISAAAAVVPAEGPWLDPSGNDRCAWAGNTGTPFAIVAVDRNPSGVPTGLFVVLDGLDPRQAWFKPSGARETMLPFLDLIGSSACVTPSQDGLPLGVTYPPGGLGLTPSIAAVVVGDVPLTIG